jgi:ketosteroid isomerase-like protein
MWPIETDGTEISPLLDELFATLEKADKEHFLTLWHEDIICDYPMVIPGVPNRIVGLDEFSRFEDLSFSVRSRKFTPISSINLGDPSWMLKEVIMEQEFPWPGGQFKTALASVFGARDGKIAYMREYYDTAAMAKCLENAPSRFREYGS